MLKHQNWACYIFIIFSYFFTIKQKGLNISYSFKLKNGITYYMYVSSDSAIHKALHQACAQDRENPMPCKKKWIIVKQWTPHIREKILRKKTNSGSSFRTLVVRAPAKAAPRWTARKFERKRKKLSLSAWIVKPAFWWKYDKVIGVAKIISSIKNKTKVNV